MFELQGQKAEGVRALQSPQGCCMRLNRKIPHWPRDQTGPPSQAGPQQVMDQPPQDSMCLLVKGGRLSNIPSRPAELEPTFGFH